MKKRFLAILLVAMMLALTACGETNTAKEEADTAHVEVESVETVESESTKTPNEFTLRDGDGNILMQGGIASVYIRTVIDSNGITSYVVEIGFTDAASEKFAAITSEHIGECVGIYLNDDMLANPMVPCAITEGICQITNMSSYREARALARKIRKTVEQ